MIKFLKNPLVIAIVLLVIANVAIFWQFYFRHLIPFPGNLLVSYYFPWNSGGFAGFDPWTTRKDVTSMDVIRMMYPWKTLAFDIIKSGHWPLWNPFNFSGMPLVGDFQSSIFFPLNFLFFVLPYLTAWITLVISLPFLFSFFIYLFLRSCKLSNLAAVFGAIVLSNISYLVVWSELVVMLQNVLFLPLILWLVNRFIDSKKIIYLWIIPLLLGFSVLGGHPQTFLYTYLISLVYCLFKKVNRKILIVIYLFSIPLAAVQLLPSFELFQEIGRGGELTRSLISQTALPWKNLVTMLAPDFFGNPSTGNFWGNNYDNSLAYFGVVSAVLAIYAIIKQIHNKEVLFWLIIGLLGLVFALPPFANIILFLRIPVLSTSYLSRSIFYFEFSMVILSAYGLDFFLKNGFVLKAKQIVPYLLIAGVYIFLIVGTKVSGNATYLISFKNLILPAVLFFASLGILFFFGRQKMLKLGFILGAVALIVIATAEHSYFYNKYQPFSEAKFVFPSHPVFDFLKKEAGVNRYFGVNTAYIDNNFATYFRVYTPEGYDPMFIRRYARLLAGSDNGHFGPLVSDHDAFVASVDSPLTQRLFDLLGVKYIIDKTDDPQKDLGPNLDKFKTEQYSFVKQIYKWKFYQRNSVLPRAYIVGSYAVKTSRRDILSSLYDLKWNPKNSVILEVDPKIKSESDPEAQARIIKYEPNNVSIETKSTKSGILVLSDTFYSGWRAFSDGKEVPIYRANYTFRAVAIKPGTHLITMIYDPVSFKLGLLLTSFAGIAWLSIGIFLRCVKK